MELRIRPYTESRDYGYIERWIDDERMHALWCANLIPYPVTPENLRSLLEKNAAEWADCAYIVTDSNGENIGFFCYSVNADENTGFLKFIIIDRDKRGLGYGREMLKLALKHAFDITGVKLVRLNVFDENAAAKHCYEKVGFVEESIVENIFPYKNESWSRCLMVIHNGSDKFESLPVSPSPLTSRQDTDTAWE